MPSVPPMPLPVNDDDPSFNALFGDHSDNSPAVVIIKSVCEFLANLTIKERNDLYWQGWRFTTGKVDEATADPLIYLIAACHGIWTDGYDAGRKASGG